MRIARILLLACAVACLMAGCMRSKIVRAQTSTALMPVPKLQFFSAAGAPLPGGKVYTYAAGTSNPLTTYSDSAGTPNANPVVLDSGGMATIYLGANSYKIVLKNAGDVTQWTQDNVSDIGQILKADIATQVLTKNLNNIRFADQFSGADWCAKVAAAASDLPATGGTIDARGLLGTQSCAADPFASVNKPITLLVGVATISMSITTGAAAISLPTGSTIFGSGRQASAFAAVANGAGCFKSADGLSAITISDLSCTGNGTNSTAVGILLTNTNRTLLRRIKVQGYSVGVRLATGTNSSYLNTITDSEVISNNVTNIDLQAGSNATVIRATTFGGLAAASSIGIKMVDSQNLLIDGGDCEGNATNNGPCVDIDDSDGVGLQAGSVHINAVYFEGAKATNGYVRLGATNIVAGIVITNCFFSPGTGGVSAIYATKVDSLFVSGGNDNGYREQLLNIGAGATRVTWIAGGGSAGLATGMSYHSGKHLFYDAFATGFASFVAPAQTVEVQGTTQLGLGGDPLYLVRNTTAINSGVGAYLKQKNAASNYLNIASYIGNLSDNTAAAEYGRAIIQAVKGGTLTTALTLQQSANAVWATLAGSTQAGLGAPSDGTFAYCSDCKETSESNNVCAGGGTGAWAIRLNGAWQCLGASQQLSGSASLDFAAWAGTDCQSLTLTVTGAADGNTVALGIPNVLASVAGVVWSGFVSAADTVTVRGCKITAGASADPAAATVRANVWQ